MQNLKIYIYIHMYIYVYIYINELIYKTGTDSQTYRMSLPGGKGGEEG